MSEKKAKAAKKPGKSSAAARKAPEESCTALAVPMSASELMSVGAVARRLGFGGYEFDEMARTWLKKVVEDGGVAAAKGVVHFMAGLMEGRKSREALEEAGLTWGQLVMLMDGSPDFEKVLMDAYRIRKKMMTLRKESMGDDVLDTAFDMATVGEEQYCRQTGAALGYRKKSEKMLDRLLILAGTEFSRDGRIVGEGGRGNGGGGNGITLNFHFDGKGRPNVTTEVLDV